MPGLAPIHKLLLILWLTRSTLTSLAFADILQPSPSWIGGDLQF